MPWCETIGDRSIQGGQGPVDPTADINFASLGISAIDEHRHQVVYATLTAVSFDTTTDIDWKTLLC